MIVNPYSVTGLVVDSLSSLLAIAALYKTGQFVLDKDKATKNSGEKIRSDENTRYLLFWMTTVLVLLRILAYPFFYLVLQSFVPDVRGAMCIYGATKLLPRLTLFLEILKPTLVFLSLVWFLLYRLERHTERLRGGYLSAGKLILVTTGLCLLLGLIDSVGSMFLWLKASADLSVSCCTTILNIPSRFTVWIPETLIGPHYTKPLWYLFYGINACAIVSGAVGYRILRSPRKGFGVLIFTSGVAALGGCITLLALVELVAPNLLGLSFHHCIYCLVQYVLDGAVLLMLLIFGSFAFMAIFPLYILSRQWADRELLRKQLQVLMIAGSTCLSGSLLMVTVHLLL